MRWLGHIVLSGLFFIGLLISLDLVTIADLDGSPRWFRIFAALSFAAYSAFLFYSFIHDYRSLLERRRQASRKQD